MAILRTDVRPPFKIGDWVRSVPIGRAGPFNGQIISTTRDEFVVKDSFGRRWCRLACELSPVIAQGEAER